MSAIDRIMRAYSSKHSLNREQSALIRTELSAFIAELMSGKRPQPVFVSAAGEAIRSDQGAFPESFRISPIVAWLALGMFAGRPLRFSFKIYVRFRTRYLERRTPASLHVGRLSAGAYDKVSELFASSFTLRRHSAMQTSVQGAEC
jgi:hypothetical protein